MILDINNPKCENEIMLWAKSKGLLLTKTYSLPSFSQGYIIKSQEELNTILNTLPEKFYMRSDYRLGNRPIYVSGQNGTKDMVSKYLETVKDKDEFGAIIIYFDEDFCESYNTDGAFYVTFNVNNAVYIDYVGKGFDGREISHGKAVHESFYIPWDEVPFFQENKMGVYRKKLVNEEEYLQQRELRIQSLSSEELDEEFLEANIPKQYKPMSAGTMQEIKDKIIFPLFNAKDLQRQYKEYTAICNIQKGKIICAEIYRSERHLNKEDISR